MERSHIPQWSQAPKGQPAYQDTMAEAVVEYVDRDQDLKAMYDRLWDDLIDFRLRVETAINSLKKPMERMVMRHYYFDGLSWREVALRLGYEERQVHRIHGSALQRLA